MDSYVNSFMRGRTLLKRLLFADCAAAVFAFVVQGDPGLKFFFSAATVILFIAIIYIAMKYCRCPNCGKRILLGVLVIDTCPKCRHNLSTGKKAKKRK